MSVTWLRALACALAFTCCIPLPPWQTIAPAMAQQLTCGVCGRSIEGRYLQNQQGNFHPACYADKLAPRCAICSQAVMGTSRVDRWGFHAHAEHGRGIHQCAYCGRIIGQGSTGGGVTYTDGRLVCNLCRRTAVDTPEAGVKIMKRVRDRIAQWGLMLDSPLIPLALGMRPWLQHIQRQGSYAFGGETVGLTRAVVRQRVRGAEVLDRQVDLSVFALAGLPEDVFASVMGHELMHAWGHLAGSQRRQPQLEEGAARYVEALILAETGTPESTKRLEMIQYDDDPTYGAGFRRVRRFVEMRGWPALLEILRTQHDLPPGY
ncbi:MAG: protein DA1 [Candidatus Sericytochromatia bacterium]|nr:protein DA1 [Candidatus Sericytochromatia bacterium]